MKFRNLLFASCLSLVFASCSKDTMQDLNPGNPSQSAKTAVNQAAATVITEDFETGSKGSYAAGDVTLSTGSWNLDDALIGSTASDVKSGAKSVRIRNTGILSMNFNVSSPTSVSVKHAVYGSDNSSAWQLWVSNDNGSTYAQVGSTVTSSASQLATATFSVTQTGNLTFQIRKTSGGTARINIDDISFTTGGTVPPDPGTGPGTPGNTTDNNNLLLGNPTNAQNNISSTANYLMDQTYYTESYNRDKGTPNWVSWHITSTDLGSSSRANNFRADINLPSGWYAVSNTSYSGSGFDRGHNCPSGDRTSDNTANSATFLMTNMIPQAPKNNQQTWANLENYTRSLVNAGNEVYIVMGSYGSGGTGTNGYVTTIDGGHVNVPSHIWKVIVVIPNGNNDLSRITTSTRVIAVDTPNDQSTVNSDWKQYLTTVRSIESASGVNIMSNVSQSIQDVLETRTDSGS